MHVSTYLTHYTAYNEKTSKYELVSEAEEEATFFDFNKGFTTFKHTTPKYIHSFVVRDVTKVSDGEEERWEFSVVSDAGHSYLVILDLKENNIRFIFKVDEAFVAIQYSIKKLWFDE